MKLGIYVHIPFCLAKCHYCDFNSFAGKAAAEKEQYLLSLAKEGELYKKKLQDVEARSLYIGGGTPTCLTGGQIFMLFENLHKNFHISNGIEITVEGNPGTLDREKLRQLQKAGCNRLSLGVQSFSSRDLKVLGRIHTPQDVYNTIKSARQMGFDNINLDLMYGLPGQDIKGWRENLKQVVELAPEHISLYQLNIEKGTPFYNLLYRGFMAEFDQDEAYIMYKEAIEYLGCRGYHHYEISNFSLPDRESFHNKIYWHNEEYLGLGAGASGYLQGVRYTNIKDPGLYSRSFSGDTLPVSERETIDDKLAMAETMFLGLRLLEGVEKNYFMIKHGISPEVQYSREIAGLVEKGLLKITPTHIALSPKGLFVANLVFQEFLP
jgi:oxygen-independent coproporphyrinogen-3 oxidase